MLYTTARTEVFPVIVKRKITVYTISRKIFDANGSFMNSSPDAKTGTVLWLTSVVEFVGSIKVLTAKGDRPNPTNRYCNYHKAMTTDQRRPF